MFDVNRFRFCTTAVLVFILGASTAAADMTRANDAWITRSAMQTDRGHLIPVDAFGIFVVDRPREVMLLALRGKAGRGDVILRSDESGQCLTFQARFVAGDFGGDSVGGHLAAPVEIVLQSRRVARALARGHDVVSDSYRVAQQAHPDADIVLGGGLEDSFGFVINPGRNIIGDVFGVTTQRIDCVPMS